MFDNFQNIVRSTNIKSLTLSIEDLGKLFELIKKLNEEAKEHQVESIIKMGMASVPVYPYEVVEDAKKVMLEKYVVGVEIYTTKGQYFRYYNPEEAFDKNKLPDNINRIVISNTLVFNLQRELIQPYRIIVDLNFSRTTLLDFLSNPSYETFNPSKIEVWGLNESWTYGAHEKLSEYIKIRSNKRYWIHSRNIYDLFIWALIVPIVFRILYKIDLWLNVKIIHISSVLFTFIYIYLFIVGLLIFNLSFKYLRRSFPPMELKSNLNTKGKIASSLILLFVSSVGIKMLYDIIRYLVSYLF